MNNYNIKEVAARIKVLREDLGYSIEKMARGTKTTVENYVRYENGETDLPFSFLSMCADIFGIDLVELFSGESPTLKKYTIVRKGCGFHVERRKGLEYKHLAYLFKNKKIEPLYVECVYDKVLDEKPVYVSSHNGQEMNYILSGKMKFVINGSTFVLEQGDCIYYDASCLHGMVATGGCDCRFLTILV